MKKVLLFLIFLSFVFAPPVLATVGVGVGTGKIQINEKLHGGTIYQLPSLTVINTGTEPSDYEVSVSYLERQSEAKPPLSWFSFSPQSFHLEPGKAQTVDEKLSLPLNAVPGNYFAYLEARPTQKGKGGTTTIGIAAAAKLYFTVVPSNIFDSIYYRIVSLIKVYEPWPTYIGLALAVVIIISLGRKFLNIQIGIKKPSKNNDSESDSGKE